MADDKSTDVIKIARIRRKMEEMPGPFMFFSTVCENGEWRRAQFIIYEHAYVRDGSTETVFQSYSRAA